MNIVELILIAIGLSMDAFAVSVCKGLSIGRTTIRQRCIAGVWFGGFQALMPLIGYLLGIGFKEYIDAFDHWIAFGLLALIGANMLRESLGKEEHSSIDCSLGFRQMLLLAIATSIDALAVGVSFAILNVNILWSITIIGITTFLFSFAGMKIGEIFGTKYKTPAEIAGGIILILIGLKILLEHLLF